MNFLLWLAELKRLTDWPNGSINFKTKKLYTLTLSHLSDLARYTVLGLWFQDMDEGELYDRRTGYLKFFEIANGVIEWKGH